MNATRRSFLSGLAVLVASPMAALGVAERKPVVGRPEVLRDMIAKWRRIRPTPKTMPDAWILGPSAWTSVRDSLPSHGLFRHSNVEFENFSVRGIPAILDNGFPPNAIVLVGPGSRIEPV